MRATLNQMAQFTAAGTVGLLALCMLGGAYHPHSIAGLVFRFIFA